MHVVEPTAACHVSAVTVGGHQRQPHLAREVAERIVDGRMEPVVLKLHVKAISEGFCIARTVRNDTETTQSARQDGFVVRRDSRNTISANRSGIRFLNDDAGLAAA